jgi:hypothetical protein
MKVEIIGVGAAGTEKGREGALLVSLGRCRRYTAS